MDVDGQRDELLAAFSQNPSVVTDAISINNEAKRRQIEQASEDAQIKAERDRSINKMRERWSCALLWSIVGIITFDALFSLLLGFKVIHFDDEKLVIAFIIESLVKIGGLAVIVVKFLFDPNSVKD